MIPAVLVNCCVPHNFQNKLPCIGAVRPVNPGKVFQKFFKAVLHCIFRLFPVVKNPIGNPVHPLFVQLIHGFQQLSKILLFQGSPPPLFSFIIYNECRKENLTKLFIPFNLSITQKNTVPAAINSAKTVLFSAPSGTRTLDK